MTKDPIDILAERLARLEAEGHISPAQRQKATDKLNTAKGKRPPKPPKP
jgi:hypothetical protein